MKFKKEYTNITKAFMDYSKSCPCEENNNCNSSCPFYPFIQAFDLTCVAFCINYPKAAANIMELEIIEEEKDENS